MRRKRSFQHAWAAGILLWLLVVPPSAAVPDGPIDLLTDYDTRIDGVQELDGVGALVDGGGDINDDGTPDIIMSSSNYHYADNNSREDSGSVYVIFGDPSADTIDLANLGSRGFRIDGAAEDDHAGESAAIAGDVNDDGFDDIVIGAPDADNNSRVGSGSAYVVFGKASTTNVDLASLGTGGFRIDGQQPGDAAGRSVGGEGDVNDDGINDVLVGATGFGSAHGAAWVVFGSTSPTNVDLLSYTNGFQISGAAVGDLAGASVADAGDVNDDGLDDIVVGAPSTDYNSRDRAGTAYVVFGKEDADIVQLSSLGDGGFRIDGPTAEESVAHEVDGGRDVNDDGLDDIVVSQAAASYNDFDAGAAHVVFGKSTTTNIDLASLGNDGFRIEGAKFQDSAGSSVALAGDVDGDGLSDIIVGARQTDKNSRADSGSAYVVFGKTSTSIVELGTLGNDGFRIDGAEAGDEAGTTVARAGDVDGNGLRDVLIGAPHAGNNARDYSGSAWVELVWLEGDCANALSGTDGPDTLTGSEYGDDITGGDGDDTLEGKEGNDCLEGESDADDLEGGEGSDIVNGGGGADETVAGGKGDDTVNGGDGADLSVTGGDGSDSVTGENGSDTLVGGAGADDLDGGSGDDTATGGEGGDELDGGDDEDTLEGNAGDDTLRGDADRDTLEGGDDADTLKGGDGKDTLEGDDGKDTITGGAGEDTIESGGGDDVIKANDGSKDTIDCGGGQDDVEADNKDVLTSC